MNFKRIEIVETNIANYSESVLYPEILPFLNESGRMYGDLGIYVKKCGFLS